MCVSIYIYLSLYIYIYIYVVAIAITIAIAIVSLSNFLSPTGLSSSTGFLSLNDKNMETPILENVI